MVPCKLTFEKSNKRRNMWLFDAGLHTQNMKMKKGELDEEFVERFLASYFNGCRQRGGKKYRYYVMDHQLDDNYVSVWGVK